MRAAHLFGKALRETGQALDRVGLTIAGNEVFKETFSRHRPVMNVYDQRPLIANGVFVAPNASVVGDVLIGNDSSIWYGAVVRGDKSKVYIGMQTNIQDRAVLSTVPTEDNAFPSDVYLDDRVTVGHGALLTSCKIGSDTLVGQGAIVQEGSIVGTNCIIAAGAVVLPGTLIPNNQLWAGNPAVYVRDVTDEEFESKRKAASGYVDLSKKHDEEFLPFGTQHWNTQS